MLTTEFKNAYSKLNKEQKRAVDTIEGPIMVIAGPGTGKTTILTLRIANILEKTDTGASGILALTFTEAGVKAMRSKLKNIIGSQAEDVHIHTFHGLASSIIKEFDDHFPEISRATQITEVEAEDIIRDILKTPLFKQLRPLGEPDFYVNKILSTISDAKQEAWTPEMLTQFANEEIDRITNDESSISTRGATKGSLKGEALKRIEKCKRTLLFANVYKIYEQIKKEQRKIDFDDLIFEVLKTIREDKLLLQMLQEKFLYILVDEHQDTNNAQNLLVRSIADFFDTPNLFVVGDEKQAIYRFQGASVANFLEFKNAWQSMEIIPLTENYRSHQGILDSSFKMIENNYEDEELKELRIKLSANNKNNKKVKISIAEDRESEETYLVQSIKSIIEKDDNKNVAVIVRKNKDISRLLSLFDKNNIKATAERGVDIFHHPIGLIFFSLILFITDQSQTEALIDTISRGLWGLSFKDQIKLIQQIKKGELEEAENSLTEIKHIKNALNEKGVLEYLTFISDVSKFTDIIKSSPTNTEIWRGIYDLAQNIAKNQKIEDPKQLLLSLISYQKSAEKKSIKIKSFKHEAKVTVLTAHSSKGLEYDYVFIPFATEENWIRKNRGLYFVLPQEKGDEDDIKDERRLFYVAITRAKEHVTISSTSIDNEGNPLTQLRFIDELDENSIEIENLEKIEMERRLEKIEDTKIKQDEEKNEYIKYVLEEKGLSVTALNHFLECPLKFFYKSILKIPEAPNATSEKGNAMHEAFAHVWQNKNKDSLSISNTIKNSVETYMQKSLLPKFEKEIILEELIESADTVATELEHHFNQEGHIEVESWKEKTFSHIYDNKKIEINIHGKIDAIVEKDKEILVFDYKTKTAMSEKEIRGETKNSDGGYFRQLIFYKILLGKEHNKSKEIIPSLVFIKPDTKGRCPIVTIPVTESDVERVKIEIQNLIEKVWSNTLLSNKCQNPDCTYCK